MFFFAKGPENKFISELSDLIIEAEKIIDKI